MLSRFRGARMLGVTLSVVIPAHNAAKFLRSTIDLIEREMRRASISYEILIMENGSSDATPEVSEDIAREHSHVRSYLDPKSPGKGNAITKGILLARGDFVCFCDADLEIPPEHIIPLLDALREGFQIATVSKRHPRSVVSSPWRRTFLSTGYNLLVRTMFGTKLYSHQDGLKAFRREDIIRVLPFVRDGGWFWDTEVLVIAKWMGYRIQEFPIRCDYGWESTFDPVSGIGYFMPRLISLLWASHKLRRQVRHAVQSLPPTAL